MEAMANAAAEGVKSAGGHADVKRVAETMPVEVQKNYHYKMDQKAPVAAADDLANYDGIIFATPTRFGMMAGQMKSFFDQTGGLWQSGALVGKVGSVMVGAANQHGGQESTILSFHTSLLHQGMVIVGLPYSFTGQMGHDELRGGSPYGASTTTAGDGSRMPAKHELEGAHFQGAHVAKIAAKLAAK